VPRTTETRLMWPPEQHQPTPGLRGRSSMAWQGVRAVSLPPSTEGRRDDQGSSSTLLVGIQGMRAGPRCPPREESCPAKSNQAGAPCFCDGNSQVRNDQRQVTA
jgi:hypothetical protein